MRFFHTFNSIPMVTINRWGKKNKLEFNIKLAKASAISIKQVYPEAELVLYCNKDILDRFTSTNDRKYYDNIYILQKEYNSEHLWAYSKIEALEREPIGSIGIDTDIIFNIDNKDSLDSILSCSKDCDVFFQNLELPYVEDWYFIKPILGQFIPKDLGLSCGIIRINNINLKKSYLSNYYSLISNLKEKEKEILERKKEAVVLGKSLCLDLIFEQALLYYLIKKDKYSYKTVFKNFIDDRTTNLLEKGLPLGYEHYYYLHKYTKLCEDRVKNILK